MLENKTGEVGGVGRVLGLVESRIISSFYYFNQSPKEENGETRSLGGSEQVVAADLQGAHPLSLI